MARYIDADKAIENIKLFKFWDRLSPYEKGVNFAVNSICRELADVTITPTADVAEVKHGEWVLTKTEFGWNCCEYPTEYKCSLCGRTAKQEESYCPNCGAKMDGGKVV